MVHYNEQTRLFICFATLLAAVLRAVMFVHPTYCLVNTVTNIVYSNQTHVVLIIIPRMFTKFMVTLIQKAFTAYQNFHQHLPAISSVNGNHKSFSGNEIKDVKPRYFSLPNKSNKLIKIGQCMQHRILGNL